MKKRLFITTALILAASPVFAADITGTGTVITVDAAAHIVKLKHDPVPALGWPAMTMNFSAGERVDLSDLKAGDAITFTLTPQGSDDYIISGIEH